MARKIAIVFPVFGRLAVTRLFWKAISRLAADWRYDDVEVAIYAVGSEPEHEELADRWGGTWINRPNRPLTGKWNAGMRRAFKDGADHFVMLGSDNLVTPRMGRMILEAIPGAEYGGVQSGWIVDPMQKRRAFCHAHNGEHRADEPIGLLRWIGRSVLEQIYEARSEPWPWPRNRDLDGLSHRMFRKFGGPARLLQSNTDAYGVDIKTDENIWLFDHLVKSPTVVEEEYGDPMWGFPPGEQELFKRLEV